MTLEAAQNLAPRECCVIAAVPLLLQTPHRAWRWRAPARPRGRGCPRRVIALFSAGGPVAGCQAALGQQCPRSYPLLRLVGAEAGTNVPSLMPGA